MWDRRLACAWISTLHSQGDTSSLLRGSLAQAERLRLPGPHSHMTRWFVRHRREAPLQAGPQSAGAAPGRKDTATRARVRAIITMVVTQAMALKVRELR